MPTTSRDLLERPDVFPQLKHAIELALDAKEKSWGLFRVRCVDGGYQIEIPHMDALHVKRTSDRQGYKAIWGNARKPTVTTRKRRKTVTDRNADRDKVQRTYEVLYQLDSRSAFRQVNQAIAIAIRDRLRATLTANSDDELAPLVLLVEQSGDR